MVLIGGVAIMVLVYSSKFFFDAAAHIVRSFKRLFDWKPARYCRGANGGRNYLDTYRIL